MKIENGIVISSEIHLSHDFMCAKDGTVVNCSSIVPAHPNQAELKIIRGIVVHQTETNTLAETFGPLRENKQAHIAKRPKFGRNSFHFLIDKDGKIYQTFSLKYKANHIGLIHSRCIKKETCTPVEQKEYGNLYPGHWNKGYPEKIHEIERKKENRFPMNEDSIGIECVGKAYAYSADGKTRLDDVKSFKGIPENRIKFEPLTSEQLQSLEWLIRVLASHYGVLMSEVFRHPEIARKNPTESISAKELIERLQKEEVAEKKAAEEAAKKAEAIR